MSEIDRLIGIMARLRDPESGCPWDLQQDFQSIAPYTIEEAYEVADAIARDDMEDLQGELGDLLLQVVYHAQLGQEAGLFGFEDVARSISDKLVRRHPHVFGASDSKPISAIRSSWEDTKAQERAERERRRNPAASEGAEDPFADIPVALPALRRAGRVLGRAERAGFADPAERPAEVASALLSACIREASENSNRSSVADSPRSRAEIGDLLLLIVQLARHCGVDPERALGEQTRAYATRAQETSGRR